MPEIARRGFSNWQLVWSNLKVRPIRTGLCVVAVAIQVVLILLIVGMIHGVVAEWGQRVEGVGADVLVRPPNSSVFFAFSTAMMQQSDESKIAAVPEVKQVAPVLVLMDTHTMDIIYGIDYSSFNALGRGFLFEQGGPFRGPNDVIVDDIKAKTHNYHVGETIEILGRRFTICGIAASGRGARLFIQLPIAQEITGADHRVSMFYVRSAGQTEATRQALLAVLPNYRILSMNEYLTLMNSSSLPELRPFVNSMVGLGVSISFLVVCLAMYTVVLERTREIGILKSLGASRAHVVQLILGETALMAIIGILLGLGVAGITDLVLRKTLPSLPIEISFFWILTSIGLALAATALGALYPAYRAARFDPVDALAYE
jgi:putative ABC transport system permease protein